MRLCYYNTLRSSECLLFVARTSRLTSPESYPATPPSYSPSPAVPSSFPSRCHWPCSTSLVAPDVQPELLLVRRIVGLGDSAQQSRRRRRRARPFAHGRACCPLESQQAVAVGLLDLFSNDGSPQPHHHRLVLAAAALPYLSSVLSPLPLHRRPFLCLAACPLTPRRRQLRAQSVPSSPARLPLLTRRRRRPRCPCP